MGAMRSMIADPQINLTEMVSDIIGDWGQPTIYSMSGGGRLIISTR